MGLEDQISANLFSVKMMLKSRGFNIHYKGDRSDLLINIIKREDAETLFKVFNNQKYRNELLGCIHAPNKESSNGLVNTILKHPSYTPERNKYSTTFEWYVGELMVRTFSAFSYSYGVEIKNVIRNSTGTHSGDYDVLAVLRNLNLMYFECKTGSFNRTAVLKCTERALALHCEAVVLFVKDPINENSISMSLKDVPHPLVYGTELLKINIKHLSQSTIYVWNNCYFVSATGDVQQQLNTVMRLIEARKSTIRHTFSLEDDQYDKMGYDFARIF